METATTTITTTSNLVLTLCIGEGWKMMDLIPSTYTKNGDVHAMIHLKDMYPNDYVMGVKYSGASNDYQPYVSETFQPRESSAQCAKRGATEELGASY